VTDRLAGLTVTFAADVREDDAEAIIHAIRMIKGVVSVDPLIADWQLHIATTRVQSDMTKRLYGALRDGCTCHQASGSFGCEEHGAA
jgi:hypothetical protein